ncbi:MAG: DNA mismatch repair protein MutS [Ferruginibacter sp.]
MKLFPSSALHQLEFDKIKDLVAVYCRTEMARQMLQDLRIHTQLSYINEALHQTLEYKTLLDAGVYFPNDFTADIRKDLKLLSIPGASLSGEQFSGLRRLAENTEQIFRWFTVERKEENPYLSILLSPTFYEKQIKKDINEVLDEGGVVKDNASAALLQIRTNLYRRRTELRRQFDKILQKMNKLGYLADIEESFMNGRRVLAVFAEQKRMIKGVMHGESDSRRTSYIEPEEITPINNEIFSLESEETIEVYRILKALTAKISVYAPLLSHYYQLAGEYDFISAKAKFARDTGGNMPLLKDKSGIKLVDASHPLLLIYNKKINKETIPVNLTLDDKNSILVISGPNAGGKTVTLKTVGLLQVMLQSGFLVPLSPDSEMGVFKQLLIHIGDTQSLEFELSTYSSHLKNMKHFMETANGKTLFFIDELGSGSDPNLGGAFAEVIMEELAFRHAYGIVTTHYLNLKVMANKVKGIINGAMQFDEENLLPLYKLQVGQPGSSYTFSIAERIGLDKKLIGRARKLVDDEHFRLDKLLNRTEQDLQQLDKEKDTLQVLLRENEGLKQEMERTIKKEKHTQELDMLREQNKITEERFRYVKDMERRLKAIVIEWRKGEDKQEAIKTIQSLLFSQKENIAPPKYQKKLQQKFDVIEGEIALGDKVLMKQNRQVGIVKEIKGKKAVLQVGVVPITVALQDLVKLREKGSASE